MSEEKDTPNCPKCDRDVQRVDDCLKDEVLYVHDYERRVVNGQPMNMLDACVVTNDDEAAEA